MKRGQKGEIVGLDIRLRESRERQNLSRNQVAQQIDIAVSTLADYEIGHRQPSLPILVALAEIYKVTADYLLDIKTAEPPQPLDIGGLDTDQIDALKHIIDVMKKHG